MKLFGHPIHPLLVHFPTALLPMEFVLSAISYHKNEPAFAQAGFYCLLGGVLVGFAAIVTGAIELILIPKTDKKSLTLGVYHGFINGTVILIFAVFAFRSWQLYPEFVVPSTVSLLVKGSLNFLLFFGNYFGAQLIYKHHIGITIKPHHHEDGRR